MGDSDRKRRRYLCATLQFIFLLSPIFLSSYSHALTDLTVFGPKRYDRLHGKPTVYTASFERCNPAVEGILRVTNGDGKDTKIKSASISVNGIEVAAENDFKQQVPYLEKSITVEEVNDIRVVLKSGMQDDPNNANLKEQSYLVIEIIGKGCDSAPPVISAPLPSDGSLLNASRPIISAQYADEVGGSGIDGTTARLMVDGMDVTSSATITTGGISYAPTTDLPEGSHTATVTVSDKAHNPAALTWQFTTDTQPPLLMVSTLPDGRYTNNAAFDVNGTVTDNIEVRILNINGMAVAVNADGSFSRTIALTEGANPITTIATDSAGNTADDFRTITLDTIAPSVSITSPAAVTTRDNTPSLTYTSSEGTVVVKVDGNIVFKLSGESLDALTDGAHTVRVEAADAAGNIGFTEIDFIVDSTLPLTLSGVSVNTNIINTAITESAAIFYTINGPATATLKIIPEKQGPTGTPVYQTSQTADYAGASFFTWDGKDSTGKVVPDEAYLYILSATDGATTVVYSPSAQTGTANVTCSRLGTFDPYKNEPMTINYGLSAPARITVSVTKPSWRYDALSAVPSPAGNFTTTWNGRSRDGKLLLRSGGSVYCTAKLLRENHIITTGISPKIDNIEADPYELSLAYGQFAKIRYHLDRDVNVSISLIPPTGSAISLASDQLQTAGDHEIEWNSLDMTDTTGKKLLITTEGSYTVKIQAVDSVSGTSALAWGSLQIGF